ncbi:MAG: FAD-dependent oxidoreductase [Clostridia bacterium]
MTDIIIIGGGPAGLSAAIYALRANKTVLLFEKMFVGGQAAMTPEIENYPGFLNIGGADLSYKMLEQAEKLGLEIRYDEVVGLDITGEVKTILTVSGKEECKAVILASGAVVKKLNIEGEKELIGKGVSYCATCDGNFFKNKTVAVVGGGKTSLDDCIYLSGLCKKVFLIHRRDVFSGNSEALKKVMANSCCEEAKIELVLNSVATKINGSEKLESVDVLNKITNESRNIKIDGIFIAVGRRPESSLIGNELEVDELGYVLTNEKMETNLKGVFVAGDVRKSPLKQVVTACSDGAIAGNFAAEYVK